MTRITDALKRSRSVTPIPLAGDTADAIQFFAPGQPVVTIPWELEEGPRTAQRAGARPEPPAQDRERPRTRAAQTDWPDNPRLVVSREADPGTQEQMRTLAAMLIKAQVDQHIKVILVTSAAEGDGKTLTVVNLALTLSESCQQRVLLIDADLACPSVHTMLGAANARGLSDALSGAGLLHAVQLTDNLSVLTAGNARQEPMKVLMSSGVRAVIEEARAQFDWVLIDAAAAPHLTTMASAADVALLVVRSGRTRYDAARRVAQAIGVDRIFGVVLNATSGSLASVR